MALPCEDSGPPQSRGGAAAFRRAPALGLPQSPLLPCNLACTSYSTYMALGASELAALDLNVPNRFCC